MLDPKRYLLVGSKIWYESIITMTIKMSTEKIVKWLKSGLKMSLKVAWLQVAVSHTNLRVRHWELKFVQINSTFVYLSNNRCLLSSRTKIFTTYIKAKVNLQENRVNISFFRLFCVFWRDYFRYFRYSYVLLIFVFLSTEFRRTLVLYY